ncbi:MAG: LamG-like jellyroll fold domain-containing protein [Limisphaerales bacterium]
MNNQRLLRLGAASGALMFALSGSLYPAHAQSDVTQPGDAIIASSSNTPGTEGVANAIDGQPTKYLSFDTRTDGKPSGFIVTPSIGVTRVVGISLQSANDAPERDAKIWTLEGSNDETVTAFDAGTWELIRREENTPAWTARYETQTLLFDNFKPYKHYRFTVLETQTVNGCCFQVAEVELLGSLLPQDVTQPGDPAIASSSNTPGTEGVANAIDGQPTKYLNFDTRTDGKPSGLIVTPSIGKTLVTGISMQSANDAPERDAKIWTLEGSNDDTVTAFDAGTWELIRREENTPAWTARYQTQTLLFDNYKPYKHYRFTVLETQTVNGCCFQIAEIELLGTGAPKDVTQPGDAIIASSSNTPGTEGVANAIDGQPTKYLNFDTRTDGKPSGFVVTPSIGSTTVIGISMQSANDAPERDAKIWTLEGSNDETVTAFDAGNWELIKREENTPAWTARYETQEFYFPNQKAYKHYRFTVLETQTVNGCCFQVAEVELLAVTTGNPCDKTRFLSQPVDTLVLAGAQATFNAVVNGPWSLQWYRNGTAIPGAIAASYTTEPVTVANAADTYSVEIVGCEMSSTVKAVIFAPSATKSIGISFQGGGANGSPTVMNSNDIAGIHPQAYWNNTQSAATGFFPYEITVEPFEIIDLVNSDNQVTDITFEWASSGTWGSGTGTNSATQRMLNGYNHANPGAALEVRTLTFGNVPTGTHSVIAYLVGPPLDFRDANYTVTGQTESTYYVRVINVDEYNAAPGFYRGVSTDPTKRDLATFVRFDNVRAAADGTIKLSWDTLTTGDRGAPVNALQLILNSTPAGAPPVITQQPQPTVTPEGATVTLTVVATGEGLTYQWRKDGRTLPDGGNISGAATATLTIRDFSAADEARYGVAVFNTGGSVVSRNASVRVSNYDINDALVSHWKLDEASGTTAANSVAAGKPGTVTGFSAWAAGQIGNAFNFDGSSYLFVESYPLATRQISASGWVNVDAGVSTSVAIVRNAQGQIGLGTGVAPNTPAGQFELGLVYDNTEGTLALSAAIGAGPNIVRATGPATFPVGSWQHVAFSADGAQLRLYLNGVEVASTDYITDINRPDIAYLSLGARLNVDTSEPPILGPDATDASYMIGRLDDLGIWTRGLSVEEVTKIHAAGQQGQSLTTVVLEPPVEFSISISADGIITYTGTLESSATVDGDYTTVTGATSPYTVPKTGAAMFYRAKQ